MFADDEMFDALDALVDDGTIAAYGVSVETCDQALSAIPRPHVAWIQIILNAFRLKPLEQVLPGGAGGRRRHHRAGAARLGLLSGRYDATVFGADDHRNYNRAAGFRRR